MEEIAGKDAQSPTSWRQFRRFLPYLLAISLGAVSLDVAAATYWQVQQSGITAFVEGDKDSAKRVAETALRLQSAARWLFNWPESHREPSVLLFAVDESLLRRTFQYPAESNTPYADYTAGHESWARTPSGLDFPDEIPVTSEPVPTTPEEVHVLMGKLCSRLNNCRK